MNIVDCEWPEFEPTGMTEKRLIAEYNKIVEVCGQIKDKSSTEILNGLSFNDLEIFIAGKTFQYGRGLIDSLRNAKLHMQNRQKAVKVFTTVDFENFRFK
jgi:hypothetical protein